MGRILYPPKTKDRMWLRLKTNHADYNRLINFLTNRHQDIRWWPNNELGITLSVNGSESIVKVDGADDTFKSMIRDLLNNSRLVVEVFTRQTYRSLVALLLTPEWDNGERPA